MRDRLLVKVYEYTSSGWPGTCQSLELRPFWNRRVELSLQNECQLWGRRVIVPFRFQKPSLEELHECHPGMFRMKALARSFVWWPGTDLDIEERVRLCEVCSQSHHSPKADKNPAQLFLKREPRTYLSLVKPSLQTHVEKKQFASKSYRDGLHPWGRMFDLYQPVRVKNTRGGK